MRIDDAEPCIGARPFLPARSTSCRSRWLSPYTRTCLNLGDASLTVDSFRLKSFVERFMAAGVFASRDEMIATALHELARAIEASARRAAAEQGCSQAQEASLEELVDLLDQSARMRES